jgi:hypothetical protein
MVFSTSVFSLGLASKRKTEREENFVALYLEREIARLI